MNAHLDAGISAEIREAVAGLPLYKNGPGVDYTGAKVAYTTNTILVHGRSMQRDNAGLYVPNRHTEALLVQRPQGLWSGVSGYVDTVHDPTGVIPDDEFDPIAFTARTELAEECNLSPAEIDLVELHLGERFSRPHYVGRIRVLPLLGIYIGEQKPHVVPNRHELIDHRWVGLGNIARLPNLLPGYLSHTLPRALCTLGLRAAEIQELIV